MLILGASRDNTSQVYPGSPGEFPGDPLQPEPQPRGFPPASVGAGQDEQLLLRGQLQRELDHREPDAVLGVIVQRHVLHTGVLPVTDPVLAAGRPPMAQFQIGQCPPTFVGRERGQPVPVDIGESQLRLRVWAFRDDDEARTRPTTLPGR